MSANYGESQVIVCVVQTIQVPERTDAVDATVSPEMDQENLTGQVAHIEVIAAGINPAKSTYEILCQSAGTPMFWIFAT